MAYIAKVINANDTRQGDALVATSPKNYKTVATVLADGLDFAGTSGILDEQFDDERYYQGDTVN